MRYLKIASVNNPSTDFIELNDFGGFLCTQFGTLGIKRELDFLAIKNRNIPIVNKTGFDKYSLTIEILTTYEEYEVKYNQLITFLDRNKKDGVMLYYKAYNNTDMRYCLCSIESSTKVQKRQPVVLILTQDSLWFSEDENVGETQATEQEGTNLFVFADVDNDGYYCASFDLDEETNEYSIAFFYGSSSQVIITNSCYNEIPLVIRVYGSVVNPIISLYKEGESVPFRQTGIITPRDDAIPQGYYVEFNANILNTGVWLVNESTMEKIDYSGAVNNALGSPFFYIGNGNYTLKVVDANNNICEAKVFWREEYV